MAYDSWNKKSKKEVTTDYSEFGLGA